MGTTLTRKRERQEDGKVNWIVNQSTPHAGPRCCNYSSKATCATKHCLCSKVGCECMHGDCHVACCNLPDTLLCLNAAPTLHTLLAAPLEPQAIMVSTEDPTQQGMLLLEQQPAWAQWQILAVLPIRCTRRVHP
eukprot:scaffold165132_cov85-Attheya_sp.AAC.1